MSENHFSIRILYFDFSTLSRIKQPVQADAAKTLQQKDYQTLKECAREYILSGKPLLDMCEHNAKVARKIGKNNVAMLWTFVKIMYSTLPKQYHQSVDAFRNPSAAQNMLSNRMLMATPNTMPPVVWGEEKTDDQITNSNEANDDDYKPNDYIVPKVGEFNKMGGTSGAPTNAQIPNLDALNNIVYGDTELTVEHMDCIKSLRNGFLYIGPHDMTKNFALPSDSMMNHDMQQSARNQTMSRNRRDTSPVNSFSSLLKSNLHEFRIHLSPLFLFHLAATRNAERPQNLTAKHWVSMAFGESAGRLLDAVGRC